MDIKHNYFEMELFVNKAYAALGENEIIDHAKVSKLFEQFIANKDDEELIGTLTYSGFIPDIYGADSTEETLYTSFVKLLFLHGLIEWVFLVPTYPKKHLLKT